MNFDPGPSELNFEPPPPVSDAPCQAEESIVQTIVAGSGGPDNVEITEIGLRFVRYILSTSKSARHGFVPNFKDMDTIRRLAKQFIQRNGGPSPAIQAMIGITSLECA